MSYQISLEETRAADLANPKKCAPARCVEQQLMAPYEGVPALPLAPEFSVKPDL